MTKERHEILTEATNSSTSKNGNISTGQDFGWILCIALKVMNTVFKSSRPGFAQGLSAIWASGGVPAQGRGLELDDL